MIKIFLNYENLIFLNLFNLIKIQCNSIKKTLLTALSAIDNISTKLYLRIWKYYAR